VNVELRRRLVVEEEHRALGRVVGVDDEVCENGLTTLSCAASFCNAEARELDRRRPSMA
jgi:hypothetical protein